jgi:hypothetical protein
MKNAPNCGPIALFSAYRRNSLLVGFATVHGGVSVLLFLLYRATPIGHDPEAALRSAQWAHAMGGDLSTRRPQHPRSLGRWPSVACERISGRRGVHTFTSPRQFAALIGAAQQLG